MPPSYVTTCRGGRRTETLAAYATALEFQPTYTRAAYNRATLLYNLYVPAANDEAIRLFGESTATLDQRARALAFAGQAMAYGQAVLRFGKPEAEFVSKAVDASQDALGLAPDLEESRFAVGWAHQLCKEWQRAIAEYEGVRDLGAEHAAGRRITSFALNNAGWIWLSQRTDEPGALEAAESYLWAALRYYPNKVAFVNLAEIARRKQAYETALKLFAAAVELDPCYVNAWNERAILELEIARAAALRHDAAAERRLATDAEFHHRRALHLAGDDDYRQRLTDAFRDALGARALTESG
jgi:tetratricopeptide (TPR) repeat protein